METRVCSTCKKETSVSDFTRDPRRKSGYASQCKPCKRLYDNARYKANRLNIRQRQREYNLERNYGMSQADYEALLVKQGGCCAICGAGSGWIHRQSGKPKRLAVDHDHKTGRVRGLLCDRCNTILGKAEDSPDLLIKASDYLMHPNEYST